MASAASSCVGLRSAALRHVGPAAALAADGLADLADDLAGVERGRDRRVTVATSATLPPSTPASTTTPEPQLVAQLVGDLAQRLRIADVGARGQHADAVHVARLGERDRGRRPRPACAAASRSPARARAGPPAACRRARRPRTAPARSAPPDCAQLVLELAHVVERARAGDRLDAAHALRDAGLLGDLEEADVAGAAHVRAAAELDRVAHGARRARGRRTSRRSSATAPACLASSMGSTSVSVSTLRADSRVDQILDAALLVVGHRREVREVEAQPIGRHQRALLRHVRRRAPCASAQCSRCVAEWLPRIASRRSSSTVSSHGVADAQLAALDLAEVHAERRRPAACCRAPRGAPWRAAMVAGVADLAARLAVERRLGDDRRPTCFESARRLSTSLPSATSATTFAPRSSPS